MRLIETLHQLLVVLVFGNYFKNLVHVPKQFSSAPWPFNICLIIPRTPAAQGISEGHQCTWGVYGPLTQLCQQQPAPERFSMQGQISAENKCDPRTLLVSAHPV